MLGKLLKLYLYYNLFTKKEMLYTYLAFMVIYYLIAFILPFLAVKFILIAMTSVFLAIYYLISTVLAQPMFSKSDMDFLLTLPIEEKTIIEAKFLSNVILNLLLLVTYVAPYLIRVYGILQGILIVLLLAVLMSSQPVALYNLRVHLKALISVSILAWFLTAIIGFPYSSLPLSIRVYPELAGLILLFFSLAIRNFSNYKYYVVQGVGREVEKNISFTTSHPFINIFKVVMNSTGIVAISRPTSTYIVKRFRVSTLVAISSILAIIYYILALYFIRRLSTDNLSFLFYYPFLIAIGAYAGNYGISSFNSQPLWLLVNSSIDLVKYIRYLLINRAIKLFILFLPFVIVLILIGQYAIALTVALGFPFFTIYAAAVMMRLNPIQIREQILPTNVLTFRSFLASLLAGLPFVVLIFVIILNIASKIPSFRSPLFPLIANIAIISISTVFLFWRDFWEKAINNAVEKGLV